MRSESLVAFLGSLVVLFGVALPGQAEALLRLGVDARWAAVGIESFHEEGEKVVGQRQLESLGVGARVMLGFEQFSIGPKVNFTRHTFMPDSLSYSQVDLNAHLRVGVPTARLALVAEAGPSVSLNIGGVGYNAVLGVEVDVLGWPLVDLNLGVALEYVNLPIGIGPREVRRHEGVRAMVVVGFDFTLQPGAKND